MNCEEFLSLIDSMLDGELSVESTALVNGHADNCETCGAERDRLMVLHQRMIELGDEIIVPDSLEKRVKVALADEVKKNQRPITFNISDYFRVPQMAVVAAILCLIAVGLYFSNLLPTAHESLISATDLTTHTHDHIVSNFQYSPEQLPALIKKTGFEIKPPLLAGWRLGSICICTVGKDGQPIVHMTYVSTLANKKVLTCYQVLSKHFDDSGMSEQKGAAQEPIWSSEINNLAIAFVKRREVENIFVGAIPVRDLISIVAK
jgi:hypothetical protein